MNCDKFIYLFICLFRYIVIIVLLTSGQIAFSTFLQGLF